MLSLTTMITYLEKKQKNKTNWVREFSIIRKLKSDEWQNQLKTEQTVKTNIENKIC